MMTERGSHQREIAALPEACNDGEVEALVAHRHEHVEARCAGIVRHIIEEAVLPAELLPGRPAAYFSHERVCDRLCECRARAGPSQHAFHVPARTRELRCEEAHAVITRNVTVDVESFDAFPAT